MGFKPWPEVESIWMGTLAAIQKQNGRELARHYHREIFIKLKNVPVYPHDGYREHYDRSWTELFDYIASVAPHVGLFDKQEHDYIRHERQRNQQ
ncbi:hypothetical protein [Nocardia sp. NPDC004604]|uniref:hypothetical protein n=1 Tax=Nocardia sp. NPDC004604 TaxID=3157013 RepID=UPI0033BC6E38